MKRFLLLLCIIIITGTLFAEKKVKLYTEDERHFLGQLLYGSDSLLYVWTGLSDFDQSKLNLVKAIPYTQIKRIDLKTKKSWKEGIETTLHYSLVAGTGFSLLKFKEKPIEDKILSIGVSSIIFSIASGAVVSVISNFPKKINNPNSKDFNLENGKFRKYLILKKKNFEIINKLILEVKS